MNAIVKQVAEDFANAIGNGVNKGIELATAPTKARKPKATKAETAPKATKAKAPKAPKVKPAYVLYDDQNAIAVALHEIGTEIEGIQRRVAGVLRDKTCILAANYIYLQSMKEGGWEFDQVKVSDWCKEAMFPKSEDDDGFMSKSSLYRNVDMAVQFARLLYAKVGKFELRTDEKSGELRVMAPWNSFEPTVKYQGKDVKNTNAEWQCVPNWAIEARYGQKFDDKPLNQYGRINTKAVAAMRTPQAVAVASKPLNETTLPEALKHVSSLAALLPDDKVLKGENREEALAAIALLEKAAGVDTSVAAKSELAEVVEVEIINATFPQLLQAVRERLPASDKEWSRCSNEERELMSLIAERIMLIATPVALTA